MKSKELTPKQLIGIVCPTCGAAVGERCELHSGALRSEPHRNRKLSAADVLETSRRRDASTLRTSMPGRSKRG